MKRLLLLFSILTITFSACEKPEKDEIIERIQQSDAVRLIEFNKEEQTLFEQEFSSTTYLFEADVRLQINESIADANFGTCSIIYQLAVIDPVDFNAEAHHATAIADFKSKQGLDSDDHMLLKYLPFGPKKICYKEDCTLLFLNEKEEDGYILYLNNRLYKIDLVNQNGCSGWYPLIGFYEQHLSMLLNVDPERLEWSNSGI